MPEWVEMAGRGDLPPGTMKGVQVKDEDILVGNIAGGSNEMMKLIIARRGLDLPR